MDFRTRKIAFIQEFLKLKNEKIISQLELVLNKEKKRYKENNTQPMTMEEFDERIDKSLKDAEQGRLTEIEQLVDEIEKWN